MLALRALAVVAAGLLAAAGIAFAADGVPVAAERPVPVVVIESEG